MLKGGFGSEKVEKVLVQNFTFFNAFSGIFVHI